MKLRNMRPKRRSQSNSTTASSSVKVDKLQKKASKSDAKSPSDIIVKIEPTYVFVELKLLR